MMKKIDDISSKEELATFVQDLKGDLLSAPDNWENATLESFLEALSAWIADMDGYYLNRGVAVPHQPTWKTIAEMLLAAKMYE